MSRAKIENDYISLVEHGFLDGVTYCVVDCQDFDQYKELPSAVSFNGVLCGKTGWNSDKNRAYYQSTGLVARKA